MSDIDTYIGQILHWQDEFPEHALAHIVDGEEEAKPLLRSLLKNSLQNYKALPEDYVGHIFALYLLAQFRDPQSFGYALEFLKLPEPYPSLLFHDFLTQSYPAVVASCYSGDPTPLYELIKDPQASYLSRVVALVAASILVNRKALARPDYARFLLGLLDTLVKEKNSKLIAVIAEEVADIHLSELYSKIKELYAGGVIDEEQFSSKLFETIMQSDYTNPRKFFLIDDIFEELNGKEYGSG